MVLYFSFVEPNKKATVWAPFDYTAPLVPLGHGSCHRAEICLSGRPGGRTCKLACALLICFYREQQVCYTKPNKYNSPNDGNRSDRDLLGHEAATHHGHAGADRVAENGADRDGQRVLMMARTQGVAGQNEP